VASDGPATVPTTGTLGSELKTATEILTERAATIHEEVNEVLTFSSLTHMDPYRGGAIWLGATGSWGALDVHGRRAQSRALGDYSRFFHILDVLLRDQPPDARRELEEADGTLREILEQSELTWIKSVPDARQRAGRALDTEATLLQRLYDAGDGTPVYAADTNALLHNLDLERWTFDGSGTFEIVLGPSVLVELDELKINHRNPDVRAKAEGLITRIKGYRARGQLTQGVPLRKPHSTIRALAIEPRMADSLSWLDPTNRDDRFIATVIELVRDRPRSAVTIVSRDINLQSKAELAGLPYVEPPDS
jgi:hypothetical protein